MTKEMAAKCAEIMKAYSEGRIIFRRWTGDSIWEPCKDPSFDFEHWEYRVGQIYRPFKDLNELIHAGGLGLSVFLKEKENGNIHLVTSFFKEEKMVMVGDEVYCMSELLDKFTFVDGEPCGVLDKI